MPSSYYPNTLVQELVFVGLPREYGAFFCASYFEDDYRYMDLIPILHPRELEYYTTLRYERRVQSYLAGRYVAKRAASQHIKTDRMESIFIDQGIFSQPIVVCPAKCNTQVSITHGDRMAAAVAFSEAFPVAVDIEKVLRKRAFFQSQFTYSELGLLQGLPADRDTAYTVLWTVKEALSKALKTGLTVPLSILEVGRIEVGEEGVLQSFFINFAQYSAVSFIFDEYVCSIVFPKRMPLNAGALHRALVHFITIAKSPQTIGGDFLSAINNM